MEDEASPLSSPLNWLELSRANLLHNLAGVRALCGGRQIMAVVKANAYGAGAAGMARMLADAGVRLFGVATAAEGVALRQAGVAGRIVCLAYFAREDVPALFEYDLIPGIYTLAAARLLDAEARARGRRLSVWIKVDTGLHRLGVPHLAATDFLTAVLALDGLEVAAVFTTLTENPGRDPLQMERLRAPIVALPSLTRVPLSLVSSHGLLCRLAFYGEIVRVGILLHGLEPSERSRLDADRLARADLRPIATWKALVGDVKTAAAGEQVGYALRPALAGATRVATLTVGWADGYPSAMSRGGAVLLRGRRCPVLAVSANCTMVDASSLDAVAIGDQAVLLGRQAAEEISAAEVAQVAGTSVYHVLAAVPAVTPRCWL